MSSGKKLGIAAAVAIAAALMMVGLYGTVIGFSVDVEPGDRDKLLTIEDLGLEPDPSAETITRTRFIDGTSSIEYEYENDELYVWSMVNYEHTTRDATTVYTGQVAMAPLAAVGEEGVSFEKRPDLFSWGDLSDSRVIVAEGENAGHFISARKGSTVFAVSIGGLYWDNADNLAAVLVPAFERGLPD